MNQVYLLFEDPLVNSKISNLIKHFQPEWELFSLLDPRQVSLDFTDKENQIFITTDQNLGDDLFDKLKNQYQKIIFVQENEPKFNLNSQVIFINTKYLITELGSFFEKLTLRGNEKAAYVPVNFQKIQPYVIYPADIYLRLSAEKFIKIVNKDNSFEDTLIEKLKNKDVQFVYVEKDMLSAMNKIIYTQSGKESLFKQEHIAEELNAVESLHRYINDLGVDEKVVNLTKGLHQNLTTKYNHKFMRNLFKRFQSMEGSFLYNHSYVTSVVALTVGKKFKWMTPDNNEKIYLGCMLHDLGYKNEKNALFENLTKKEIDKKPKEIADDILSHPMSFAEKLSKLDNIHQDVIKIVKDHHGIHDEGSYPKKVYPAEINLIFALFILSHEFTLGLFKINFNSSKIPNVISTLNEKFDKGAYKKILSEFNEAVAEIFK